MTNIKDVNPNDGMASESISSMNFQCSSDFFYVGQYFTSHDNLILNYLMNTIQGDRPNGR